MRVLYLNLQTTNISIERHLDLTALLAEEFWRGIGDSFNNITKSFCSARTTFSQRPSGSYSQITVAAPLVLIVADKLIRLTQIDAYACLIFEHESVISSFIFFFHFYLPRFSSILSSTFQFVYGVNLVTLSPRPATIIAFECNFLMYDTTFVCESNSFSIFNYCTWVMVELLRKPSLWKLQLV